MGELSRCFLCSWELGEVEWRTAHVKSDEEAWRKTRICHGCAKRFEGKAEADAIKNEIRYRVRMEK